MRECSVLQMVESRVEASRGATNGSLIMKQNLE
jgi:hypothetical protein